MWLFFFDNIFHDFLDETALHLCFYGCFWIYQCKINFLIHMKNVCKNMDDVLAEKVQYIF